MDDEKVISIPVTDLAQLKILLTAWYSFLQEASNNFQDGDFSRFLKTPVIYNMAKDEIELLITGDAELLKKFKEHIFKEPMPE